MKAKKLFQSASIFTKISFMTSVIIILFSVVSTAFLSRSYSREIQSRDKLIIQEAAGALFDFFQSSYNNMYNQRTLLHSTGYISDLITETRDNPSELYDTDNLHTITEYLAALVYSGSSIESAILFTTDGYNTFSYYAQSDQKIYSGYSFNELSFIKEFKESSASITVVYDDSPDYLTLSSSPNAEPVITFIIKIYAQLGKDPENPLGYLMVNYSIEAAEDAYDTLGQASDGDYYVLNRDSQVIYTNNAEHIGEIWDEAWVLEPDILFNKSISLSGIAVIGSLDTQKLRKTTLLISRDAVLIAGFGVIVMVVAIFVLPLHYGRKFHNLANAMSDISTGDFSVQLPVSSQDEIGTLSAAFNQMSTTLNEYINKTYLAQTQRRTAELYALQAQINPHFLANTIESIRMNALENDDFETSEMLKELGNLFRWMVQFDQDIIYVEDEIEYIETYLDLMKFRFEERLSFHLDAPPEIYLFGIPRFTLQPILENALSHGTPNIRPMEISVRFSVDRSTLTIIVCDNGPGLTDEDVKRLNDHIHGIRTYEDFGVALRNIHTRITLLFGKAYGLVIDSRYCLGTTVTVTLPAKEKKELETYVQTVDCR
ncbi:MAG: sensor histidine kinase [Lachnospiraceae bacterium]|nr:sensor histidine kinase [Lachnospiraceae bacterium]